MDSRQKGRRVSFGLIAGLSAALLAVGGGAAWWASKSLTISGSGVQPTITRYPTPPVITPHSLLTEKAQVYWLNSTSSDLALTAVPVTVEVDNQSSSQEILTSTLKLLLAGPGEESYTTTIPKHTELLALTVESDGIHLNLSQAFTQGGGSAEMTARLGQIIYTSTALDPQEKVWIEVEGQPLNFLGGEGLIINQPMTRADFEANFSLVQ
ncbi:GerMN domain-containing protein [Gloeocapsa sp. PCC 73106]|uniref:GerMN domain-containing protein n=1 Tax=Gloeocapsa sp. PCC 73106 TaxID=102232 RepID=UPI0002AC29EA|nr:GerMN domain-containing protein [Gloeocapsa sp. PCC 73106]ELR97289.1 spore germination protein [Gloeocapsa sp. PCC 73106]